MATDSEIKPGTEEESLYLEDALGEYEDHGFTDKKCLRCGGELVFFIRPSAHAFSCKGCDLYSTVRGL